MSGSRDGSNFRELAFGEHSVLPWLTIGAVGVLVGAIWIVGEVTFRLRASEDGSSLAAGPETLRVVGAILLLSAGAIAGAIGVRLLDSPEETAEPAERANRLYQRYLVGVGYALLLVALVNVVAFAGFAYSKILPLVFPLGSGLTAESAAGAAKTRLTPLATALVIFVTLSMSVLGALFFIANSLREHRDQMHEFDAAKFWGDLWYRLGEAILFSVVFLLAIRRFYPNDEGFFWMPIFALFLGMFVQTGERLVFGLAKRVFAAAQSLVPLESDAASPPNAPPAAAPPATAAPPAAAEKALILGGEPSNGPLPVG